MIFKKLISMHKNKVKTLRKRRERNTFDIIKKNLISKLQAELSLKVLARPSIEEKTDEHYDFISKGFDSYITREQFLERGDLYVNVIRNEGVIVALCLVKRSVVDKCTYTYTPFKRYQHLKTGKKAIGKKALLRRTKSGKKCAYIKKNVKIEPKFKRMRWKHPHKYGEDIHYKIIFTLVSKLARGKGLNQRLLDKTFTDAKNDLDVKEITASIRNTNVSSIRSFKANGYKVSPIKGKPYKNGDQKIKVSRVVNKPTYNYSSGYGKPKYTPPPKKTDTTDKKDMLPPKDNYCGY